MTHRFQAADKKKLDHPRRREALPVQKILAETGIKEKDIVADIGCGTGYFTFPVAEAVGPEGLVYALDIEPEMLKDIMAGSRERKLEHVKAVETGEYTLPLEDGIVGTAFLCTVMHEIEKKEKFLKEVNRIIIPGGRILIVDWICRETDYGPPVEHRLDALKLERNLRRTGFEKISTKEINAYFYLTMAEKKENAALR